MATRQTPVVTIPRSFLFHEIRFPLGELIYFTVYKARRGARSEFHLATDVKRFGRPRNLVLPF